VPDSREFRMGPGYEGVHREDKEKRQDWVLRGFRQFDAPVSIVVTYYKSIQGSDIAHFDCGGKVCGV